MTTKTFLGLDEWQPSHPFMVYETEEGHFAPRFFHSLEEAKTFCQTYNSYRSSIILEVHGVHLLTPKTIYDWVSK